MGTFGALSVREKGRHNALLCETPCPEGSSYPQAEAERFTRYKTAANVMIGVTAAGAVGSLVFGLLMPRKGASERVAVGGSSLRLRF